MTPGYVVRPARPEDLEALAAIENEAAALFATVGMPELQDAPNLTLAEMQRFFADGFVAVAEHPQDGLVGFVAVRPLAGHAHVQEMDVRPAHGRHGLGRALLAAALDWARAAGHHEATLSTFRDVPWNAPFYARVGFREIDLADAVPELLEVRAHEAAEGLPIERRLLMRVALPE